MDYYTIWHIIENVPLLNEQPLNLFLCKEFFLLGLRVEIAQSEADHDRVAYIEDVISEECWIVFVVFNKHHGAYEGTQNHDHRDLVIKVTNVQAQKS